MRSPGWNYREGQNSKWAHFWKLVYTLSCIPKTLHNLVFSCSHFVKSDSETGKGTNILRVCELSGVRYVSTLASRVRVLATITRVPRSWVSSVLTCKGCLRSAVSSKIVHFIVVCLVAKPLNRSKAKVDLAMIQTLLLFKCILLYYNAN